MIPPDTNLLRHRKRKAHAIYRSYLIPLPEEKHIIDFGKHCRLFLLGYLSKGHGRGLSVNMEGEAWWCVLAGSILYGLLQYIVGCVAMYSLIIDNTLYEA